MLTHTMSRGLSQSFRASGGCCHAATSSRAFASLGAGRGSASAGASSSCGATQAGCALNLKQMPVAAAAARRALPWTVRAAAVTRAPALAAQPRVTGGKTRTVAEVRVTMPYARHAPRLENVIQLAAHASMRGTLRRRCRTDLSACAQAAIAAAVTAAVLCASSSVANMEGEKATVTIKCVVQYFFCPAWPGSGTLSPSLSCHPLFERVVPRCVARKFASTRTNVCLRVRQSSQACRLISSQWHSAH